MGHPLKHLNLLTESMPAASPEACQRTFLEYPSFILYHALASSPKALQCTPLNPLRLIP